MGFGITCFDAALVEWWANLSLGNSSEATKWRGMVQLKHFPKDALKLCQAGLHFQIYYSW